MAERVPPQWGMVVMQSASFWDFGVDTHIVPAICSGTETMVARYPVPYAQYLNHEVGLGLNFLCIWFILEEDT